MSRAQLFVTRRIAPVALERLAASAGNDGSEYPPNVVNPGGR